MAHPVNRKAQSREKILDNARRLFLERGFNRTSIEDVMQACGLTRGGFYAHFKNKSHLYAEALKPLAHFTTGQPGRTVKGPLDDLIASCFTTMPVNDFETAHLSSFFAADASNPTPEVRETYSAAFRRLHAILKVQMNDDDDSSLATAAMLVGLLAVANTVDDEQLRARLFRACRARAKETATGMQTGSPPAFLWAVSLIDRELPLTQAFPLQ